MSELVQRFLEQLRETSAGTKAVAVMVAAALIGIVGVATVVSREPDYQLAFSGLSDHEVARVNKALSDAAIDFQVSQPPAPFSVYVDEDRRSSAYGAVYGAGALDKPLKGILADGGMASVFNSAEERQQGVRKREWEEMEKMLETLEFVLAARVRTSPATGSTLVGQKENPISASVTLQVNPLRMLTAEQTATVANLVSRGLGVVKKDLVISDQSGTSLFDGGREKGEEQAVEDLLAHQARYDQQITEEANRVLDSILGPNKARVTVNSEWDYDQSTTRTETPIGKGTLVSERKNTTEKPIAEARPAGVSSNLAIPSTGADPAADTLPTSRKSTALEKTNEETKEYQPTLAFEEKVRFVPSLERLSVALFLDESLDGEETAKLEDAVKAAVGFVDSRDGFQSVVLPFFVPEEESTPEGAEAVALEPKSNMVETLLKRGVEILAAMVFLFLLLKTLRSSKSTKVETSTKSSADEIDPELLARASIEELLQSDPEKVGTILTSWAREDQKVGARS